MLQGWNWISRAMKLVEQPRNKRLLYDQIGRGRLDDRISEVLASHRAEQVEAIGNFGGQVRVGGAVTQILGSHGQEHEDRHVLLFHHGHQ